MQVPFSKIYKHFLFLSLKFFIYGSIYAQTNIAPSISAVGDQTYCPLTAIPIVEDFSITDPDDLAIEAFFVQISTGYERGTDILRLQGTHPAITTSWNESEGKLTFRGSGGGNVNYVDLILAIKDLFFESTSLNPVEEKFFSFTIGDASYLPLTDHYYEYVPNIGITWSDARDAADTRTYFGLKGYLATITSKEEAQLTGEQASGAGWIGGSDTEVEGTWKWVTGPEKGTTFWTGGINGSSPNFAFWNTGEPNNSSMDANGEDYAHVTAPSVGIEGSWNDLSNTGAFSGVYQPKGYIVEYGGTPGDPVLNISASTKLSTPVILTTSNAKADACGSSVLTLNATASQGTVLWYDTEVDGNMVHTGETFSTPMLDTTTTYYVYASYNGCTTGGRTTVTATINPLPVINSPIVYKNCDEDGLADGFTDFNLNEITSLTMDDISLEVTYHTSFSDAEAKRNILNPVPYNNGLASRLYARVENTLGCFSIATIDLEVSTTSIPDDYVFEPFVCDEDERDGFYTFDLEFASSDIIAQFPSGQNLKVAYYRNAGDAQLEQNEIVNIRDYRNEIAFFQTLYVRVESEDNGDCFGIGPHVNLIVGELVVFKVPEDAIVCSDSAIELEVLNPQDAYIYTWTNENGTIISEEQTVRVNEAGIYTVTAISIDGCTSMPQTVQVSESSVPNLRSEVIFVKDNEGNNNTITVLDEDNNLGLGDYEYALDSRFGPFQQSPVFEEVAPGLHTLFARDKNGCGLDQIEVGVIGISKFMTPNNDGINDRLKILGVTSEFYNDANLFIMDRYGKLLAQVTAFGQGWEGIYQGNRLPSSDYWYVLLLTDSNGNNYTRKGHFSLIR